MKPLISVRELRKGWPGLLLLNKVGFDIYPGDKIGLVGQNGAGKTTLLKILTGLEGIDYGDISARPGFKVGWLEQYQTADSDETVEQTLTESDYSTSLRKECRAIEDRMADPTFYESSDYASTMEHYNTLQSEAAKYSGGGILDRARILLEKLGARHMSMKTRIRDLSGGERRKVALAKVLVASDSMDLLLLDEPMNHLDIDAIEWLEEFICDYQGTAIVVSHDRYLLDDTVFRIFEIESTRLRVYEGDYTDYAEQKELHLAIMKRAKDKFDKEEARQKEIILKLRGRNRFDAQIRNKLFRMAKMERPEDPELKKRILKIRFAHAKEGGRWAVSASGLSKSFGDRTLFDDVEFDVENGWRVGLIGPNGCGKTTLLKMIIGEESVSGGTLELSKSASVGYFDQGHLSLEPKNNLLEEMARVDPTMAEEDVKGLLGRYGFKGDVVYSRVEKLSGGERARLAILKLVLSPCSIIVLDEPTNHLDLFSRDAVEKAINTYNGTVITASHDRYFLDRTCDHIMAMYGGHVRSFPGNYTQYRSIVAREDEELTKFSQDGPSYYIVRKGYTDWETRKRYFSGERLKLEPDELRLHRWALETKHLIKEGE